MPSKLIYEMFVKLLSWMVLRTRSDAAKEIEILVLCGCPKLRALPLTWSFAAVAGTA